MTLKEKLAIDGAAEIQEDVFVNNWADSIDYCGGYEAGFIAGFEKAKELLRKMECSKVRTWFEIPMKHLENLGDEVI